LSWHLLLALSSTSAPYLLPSFFSTTRRPPSSTLFPYTTLFRSSPMQRRLPKRGFRNPFPVRLAEVNVGDLECFDKGAAVDEAARSEEHTSELQSLTNLVCRLLLEKKKKLYSATRARRTHG